LDIEWLLSTLFDASLLSTSKPPETAALFCVARIPLETIFVIVVRRRWTPGRGRAMICSS
jgi:hypothetical protein